VQDKHPYEWVDEAIFIIQQSGIKYKIGPFATVVEGTYQQVIEVVQAINEHLVAQNCNEWITSIQLNIRSRADVTANEKVTKFVI
jgi:uncharacterized protein YqgV (UPF0045/DUF77 family)